MRKWIVILFLLFLIFLPQIASVLAKPFFVKRLAVKTHTEIEVESLKFSWFGPQVYQKLRFTREGLSGSFDEFAISSPFWKFSGPFLLKNGHISYQGGQIQNIEGNIVDENFTLSAHSLEGHLLVKGEIHSKIHFQLQIDVAQFPLIAIDRRLDQLLGPTLNLKGSVSMQETKGQLDLFIQTDHLQTHLQGELSAQGMTLEKPLLIKMQLTPSLSSLLFKDANPLFITALSAQNPVQLRIEPEGFFFPYPYALEKLKVGKATLDLGKVRCQNGQTLSNVVAILNKNLSNTSEMDVWFTPVAFQIDQGMLTAGRMDALLANSIHICTWGKINLINDQLKMILGLPQDTLKRSFGIQNLSPNYVLKINIRGTTQSPKIDKGAAAAKIAALVAAGNVPSGGFFGKLASVISSQESTDVPPPNRPFPWER